MKTEIAMERRIYVFEDFDANDQADVFNIRDALRSELKYDDKYNESMKKEKKAKADKLKAEKGGKDGKEPAKDSEESKKEESKQEEETKEQAGDGKKKEEKEETLTEALSKVFMMDDTKSKSSLSLTDILNCLDGICERV